MTFASLPSRTFGRVILLGALVAMFGCAAAEVELPNPRRLVIHSGERLTPEKDRMEVIHDWVREQVDSIDADPSFLITSVAQEGPVYPWDGLTATDKGDSATITFQGGTDANGAYLIYAHLHIMANQGRLDRWLPEAVGANPFELEKAILSRVADTWLYQRSLFDARPYGLLDELIYANENGYLDAFILTARPDAFVEARRAWLAESPEEGDGYAEWFRQTFQREPPGLRGGRPGT